MELSTLLTNYTLIQSEIDAICKANNVDPDEIGTSAHWFSSTDRRALLALLKNKLHIQELLYTYQGGDLTNVKFLCSYR